MKFENERVQIGPRFFLLSLSSGGLFDRFGWCRGSGRLFRFWRGTLLLDHGFSRRGGRLDKFHVETLHLDRCRSARLKEGPASPLPGQVFGLQDQELGEVLNVLEAHAVEETDGLNPSEGEVRGEASEERVIPSHSDFITEESFVIDLKGEWSPLGQEFRDLFMGMV